MDRKQKKHENYLNRRAKLGAEAFRNRNKESYQRNREKTLESQKEYYRANAEKVNARVRAYHKRKPEVQKKALANYNYRHPEKVRAHQKAYRIKNGNIHQKNWANKNRARIKALRDSQSLKWKTYGRLWRDKNRVKINLRRVELRRMFPEKYRAIAIIKGSKRRAIKKLATINEKGIARFIKSVRLKSHIACFWCKNKIHGRDSHIDHIVALARGGKHSIENLCVSCEQCNLKKGAKDLKDWNLSKEDPQLILI